VRLLLDLVDVDVSDLGLVAIDDLGQLLEGGALGLDVHEVNEAQLQENPALEGERVSKSSLAAAE
jgi:hypothetical protein